MTTLGCRVRLNGLAGYWNADATTLDSGGRIVVAPVRFRPGHKLAAYPWEIDTRLFDRRANGPNFLVATAPGTRGPGTRAVVTEAEAVATFGRPYRQLPLRGIRDHGVAEESSQSAGKPAASGLDPCSGRNGVVITRGDQP